MRLIIDSREPPEIAEEFRRRGCEVEVKELPIGDIWHGGVLIERKTYSDFYGSMVSGHMHDQLIRMKEDGVKHPIIIVYRAPYEPLSKEQMAVVMGHSTTLNIPLPTFRLSKEEDFFELVLRLCKHYDNGDYFENLRAPVVIQKHANPSTTLYAALPGVGITLADRIAKKYPHPVDFIKAVEATGVYSREKWKSKRSEERRVGKE